MRACDYIDNNDVEHDGRSGDWLKQFDSVQVAEGIRSVDRELGCLFAG